MHAQEGHKPPGEPRGGIRPSVEGPEGLPGPTEDFTGPSFDVEPAIAEV